MASRDPQIQHLLRRAGFGATAAELEYYQNLGLGGTIDELIDFKRICPTTLTQRSARPDT